MSNLKEKIKEKFSLHSFRQKVLIFSGAILLVFLMVFVYTVNSKFQITDRLKGQLMQIDTGDGLDIDVGNPVMYDSSGYFSVPLKFKNTASDDYSNFRIRFSDVNSDLFEYVDIYPNINFPCGMSSDPCLDKSPTVELAFDGTLTANTTNLTEIANIRFKLKAGATVQNSTIKVASVKYAKMVDGDVVEIEFTPNNFVVNLNASAPPAAPQNLRFSEVYANSFKLGWDSVSGAVGYSIYIAGYPDLTRSAYSPSFVFTDILSSTTYTATVKAINLQGQVSPSSQPKDIITPASFDVIDINFEGQGPAPIGDEIKFYANGQKIAANIVVSGTGPYAYSYTWTCDKTAGGDPACFTPTTINSASSSTMSPETKTLDRNSEGTTWTLTVGVTKGSETAYNSQHILIVDPPATITKGDPFVTTNYSGVDPQGTELGSTIRVMQGQIAQIKLNYSNDSSDQTTVSLDSTTLKNNPEITQGTTPSGVATISFIPKNDDVGTKVIVIKVIDSNVPVLPYYTLNLQIYNVNDAPTIDAETFTWSDVSNSPATGTSKEIFANDIDFDISGGNEALSFTFKNQLPAGLAGLSIDNGSPTDEKARLVWETNKPTFDQAGSYSVVVRVTDAAGATAESTMTIVIQADNIPPVINTNLVQKAHIQPEDTDIVYTIPAGAVTDPDNSTNGIDWDIVNSSINQNFISQFSVTPTSATPTFTFKPVPNKFTSPAQSGPSFTTVTVKAIDGAGGEATFVFELTWTSVNDLPTIGNLNNLITNKTVNEDTSYVLTFGSLMGSDTETEFQDLNWNIQSFSPGGAVAISEVKRINNAKNNFEIIPIPNANGPVDFVLTLSDGEATVTSTLNGITWTQVNDAPAWLNWPGKDTTAYVYQGYPFQFVLTGNVVDPDADVTINRTNLQNNNDLTFLGLPSGWEITNNTTGTTNPKILRWDNPSGRSNGDVIPITLTARDNFGSSSASTTKSFGVTYSTGIPPVTPSGTPTLASPALTVLSSTSIRAVFADALSSTSVTAINFAITPTVAVNTVSLSADGKTVSITTAPQTVGSAYTLTAKNITSLDGTKSSGTTGVQVAFTGFSGSVSGDCNANGSLEIGDILTVLRAAVGIAPASPSSLDIVKERCNLNDPTNQTINALDAIEVYRLYRGY